MCTLKNNICGYENEFSENELNYICHLIDKELKTISDKSCTKWDLKNLKGKILEVIKAHWEF